MDATRTPERLARGRGWVLAVALAACTTRPPAAGPREAGMVVFDTRTAGAFGDATRPLSLLLAEVVPLPSGPQTFCIVGYRSAAGSELAWAHWREGRRLVLWEGHGEPGYPDDSMARSRRSLDLERDVVATEADVGGSTYVVTRAWVDAVLADCQTGGARYRVSAAAPTTDARDD